MNIKIVFPCKVLMVALEDGKSCLINRKKLVPTSVFKGNFLVILHKFLSVWALKPPSETTLRFLSRKRFVCDDKKV